MPYAHAIDGVTWRFDDLRQLLGRASPPRSGDVLAGVAAVLGVGLFAVGLGSLPLVGLGCALFGLGMGGEWASGASLVSETWPAEHRGKAQRGDDFRCTRYERTDPHRSIILRLQAINALGGRQGWFLSSSG